MIGSCRARTILCGYFTEPTLTGLRHMRSASSFLKGTSKAKSCRRDYGRGRFGGFCMSRRGQNAWLDLARKWQQLARLADKSAAEEPRRQRNRKGCNALVN